MTNHKTEDDIIRSWPSAEPVVSICCIAYNHESYIEQALDSFLMQETGFPFEILIHDDASTDKTADIIRAYEAKFPHLIKPIYQVENQYSKGVRVNPVFNFPRARGKYLAICESDDYWTDPLKLQKQVDFMEAHPDYAVCFHNTLEVDDLAETRTHFSDLSEPRDFDMEDLLEKNLSNTSALLFRNIPIEFPKMLSDISFGDWASQILHAEHGKIRYMPDVMSVYRIHGTGVWSQSHERSRIEQTIHMLQKIDEYFDYKYHKKITKTVGRFMRYLLTGYLAERDVENATIYLNKAKRYGVVNPTRYIKFSLKIYYQKLCNLLNIGS